MRQIKKWAVIIYKMEKWANTNLDTTAKRRKHILIAMEENTRTMH